MMMIDDDEYKKFSHGYFDFCALDQISNSTPKRKNTEKQKF